MGEMGLSALAPAFEKFRAVNDALWKAYERGAMPKARLVVERFSRFSRSRAWTRTRRRRTRLYFGKTVQDGLPSARRGGLSARPARARQGVPHHQRHPRGRSTGASTPSASAGCSTASSSRTRSASPSPRCAFSSTYSRTRPHRARNASSSATPSPPTSRRQKRGRAGILYAPHGAPEGAKAADYIARSYAQILEILDTLN